MQSSGRTQLVGIQFVRVQTLVGSGIAVEDEFGGVLVGQGDHSHRGAGLVIHPHAAGVDALLPNDIDEHTPESVIAHLADECGVCAQATGGHRHVGGRAAWFGIKSGHLRQAPPDFGREHVDEEFAQGCDVHGCSVQR